jgi:excisionase family DNA binding protein
MQERTLSLSEVAGLMGVSERTIRRWIKAGKLRAYKPGRDYRIPESALRQFVEESEITPKVQAPPSLFNNLEEERRSHELGFWTAYLKHLTEHLEDLVADDAEPCRRYGRADVAPGVARHALTALEVLLSGVQEGVVRASTQEVRDALRTGFILAKAADRIDELGTPSEDDIMRGVEARRDRMLTEIKFRQIVEGLELSAEEREEIFA